MAKELSNDQHLIKNVIVPFEMESAEGFQNRSSFFEYFAAQQWLKSYDISDEEMKQCLVGGSNDGGCDGVFIFYNGALVCEDDVEDVAAVKNGRIEVCILQAKEELGFDENTVMKFKTLSENLLKLDADFSTYSQRYNDSVLQAFKTFKTLYERTFIKQVSLHFKYAYVSVASELHPNVRAHVEELKKIVLKNFPSATVDFSFLDARELVLRYNEKNDLLLTLNLASQPIALGAKNDYVALVKLPDYYSFITESDKTLRRVIFEANVRDYQGNTIAVNKAIRKTLESDGTDDFWWLNNGVTILADKVVQIGGNKLQIDKPKIVNGLQTSTEIYRYFSEDVERLEKENRAVLVRVIVPESEISRDNIIFATNYQTPVSSASLRVSGAIHLKIEVYFKSKGLFYDRRKNYYRNQGKKPSEIVSITFLGQCMISVLLQMPDYARARPSKVLSDDKSYNRLYSDSMDLDVFYKCAKVGKLVYGHLWKRADLSKSTITNVVFYAIYAMFALGTKSTNITAEKIKNFDISIIDENVCKKVEDFVIAEFNRAGGTDKVAKGSEFKVALSKVIERGLASVSESSK